MPAAHEKLLEHLEDIVDPDEGHLEIDLRVLELPVRPQVLVAKVP